MGGVSIGVSMWGWLYPSHTITGGQDSKSTLPHFITQCSHCPTDACGHSPRHAPSFMSYEHSLVTVKHRKALSLRALTQPGTCCHIGIQPQTCTVIHKTYKNTSSVLLLGLGKGPQRPWCPYACLQIGAPHLVQTGSF